jgi:hypothetical protein
MRFRKLRITWSVGCGIACVLLIVLWVRSYWWSDQYVFPAGQIRYGACSLRGCIGLYDCDDTNVAADSDVGYLSEPESYCDFGDDTPQYFYWFRFKSLPGGIAIILPMWFAVATSVAAAFAPWVRIRFSLRTLLIVTTLVAVVLGGIVWSIR